MALPIALAGLALKLSPVGKFFKAIPRQVWYALAIVAAIVALVLWHNHQVKAAYKRGGNDKAIELATKAEAIKRKTEAVAAKAVATIRTAHDEQARHINLAADRERLLGPGKAALRCPALPGPAGGHEQGHGAAHDAGDRLPANDWTADASVVPWGWLVSHAQTCDLNRNEVIAWREWHEKMLALWPK